MPSEPADLHMHPILEHWEYNVDGSISGRVYGKRGFKDGEAMNTSVVPEETRFVAYVVTGSGSIYRLGERLIRANLDAKGRRLPREGEDAAHAGFRNGTERGAAAVAKSKILSNANGSGGGSAAEQQHHKQSPTGKHPNQYTYRVHAPPSSSDDCKDKRPSPKQQQQPTQRQKQPNQYSYRDKVPEKDGKPKSPLVVAEGGAAKPKHPNQYTYRPKLPQSPAAAADGAAISTPAPFVICVSRHAHQWTARLVRSQSEDHIGRYPTARAASDAAADLHAQLSRVAGVSEAEAAIIQRARDRARAQQQHLQPSLEHLPTDSSAQGSSAASAATSSEADSYPLPAILPHLQSATTKIRVRILEPHEGGCILPSLVAAHPPPSPAQTGRQGAPPRNAAIAPPNACIWIQCDDCSKWRRGLLTSLRAAWPCATDRWTCAHAEDKRFQTCESRQESCGEPHLDRALAGLGLPVIVSAEEAEAARATQKGGRDLRPMRPPKPPPDEVPRDALRARLPSGSGGKAKREREAGDESPGVVKPSAPGRTGRSQTQPKESLQYLNGMSMERSSTRISIKEDGVWRFQPAVGEQYQIEVEPEPCCSSASVCRTRQDALVWDPLRAEAEGINVPAYLTAAHKLYAAADTVRPWSSDLALQLLHAHDFDVLAATHSMATALGVDKHLVPDVPVMVTTSLVRGRSGLRVGLHLTLRHLAASVSDGQPHGFVRSTRSRTTSLDVFPAAQVPWTAAEEVALTEGMRRDGKNLHVIHKRVLAHRTLPQVVEFFYSERGQRLKNVVMEERAAAEHKAAAAAAEKAVASSGAVPSPGADGSPKKRGLTAARSGASSSSAAPKRPRPDGEGSAAPNRMVKRFGPRVIANVSVRGVNAEIRLRLRVKKVDLRRWGEVAGPEPVAEAIIGDSAGSMEATGGAVAVRCRVVAGGRVKLSLQLNGRAGRPPRPPRPRRPKEAPAALEEDEDADDANEMICTWLQCDRCGKWRIVPDNTAGLEGDVWFCEMNIDSSHNHCDVPQQPDDAVVDFSHLRRHAPPSVPSQRPTAALKHRGSALLNSTKRNGSGSSVEGMDTQQPQLPAQSSTPLNAQPAPAPRKRATTASAAPRPKHPKNHANELKRLQPSATVFAATVAAHAAKTATLAAAAAAASSEQGTAGFAVQPTQTVAPLFACVVVPPVPELNPQSHPLLVARAGGMRHIDDSSAAASAISAASAVSAAASLSAMPVASIALPGPVMPTAPSLVMPPMVASAAQPPVAGGAPPFTSSPCYVTDTTVVTRVHPLHPGSTLMQVPVPAQHVGAKASAHLQPRQQQGATLLPPHQPFYPPAQHEQQHLLRPQHPLLLPANTPQQPQVAVVSAPKPMLDAIPIAPTTVSQATEPPPVFHSWASAALASAVVATAGVENQGSSSATVGHDE